MLYYKNYTLIIFQLVWEILELLKKLKTSHVLIFSGTILIAGTVITSLLH